MILTLDIIKFIVLIIITFFTCQIISNNNKRISYIGTILICFSTAVVQYINDGLLEALIFGQFIFICFDRMLLKSKFKYLWILGIPISFIGFLKLSNTSFQIAIGISIYALIVWRKAKYNKELIEENKTTKKSKKKIEKENKEELQKEDSWKKNWIVCLILTVIVIVLFGNNYNPIKSLENENGASYLMNYTYSAMLPFNKEIKFSDVSCLATMISIFPAGLFIAIYYIFKVENKHLEFFAPTIIISIIEIMILIINKTAFIVPNYILSIGFSVLQIYIVVYIFSNVKEKLFDLKKSTYIAISGVVVLLMMPFPREISDIVKRDIPYMIFVTESVMVLNYTDRRFWKLASWIFTVLTLFESIGFLIVNFV